MSSVDTSQAPQAEAAQGPSFSTLKLILTLTLTGVIAGVGIVTVFQATQPRIVAQRAQTALLAAKDVLGDAERVELRYLVEGRLVPELPTGVKADSVKRAYLGYRANGEMTGVAIPAGERGFQDVIDLIFGYDPATKKMLGMKVISHKETPGLGDKIITDAEFVGQFRRTEAPLKLVKPGAGTGSAHEIDSITGATISSRAIVRTINNAIEQWSPTLETLKGQAQVSHE